eukprot:NODE_439_length_8587_cov_0.367224.p3 type:complete len:358 gc:universal NODE_439_length_8587_cov_0.367224:7906-6833(-)
MCQLILLTIRATSHFSLVSMIQTGTFQSVPFEDGRLLSITGCSGYDKYSLEELRVNDYLAGNTISRTVRYTRNGPDKLYMTKRTPLLTKIAHKILKNEPMDVDSSPLVRKSPYDKSLFISLHNVSGPGFEPLISASLADLNRSTKSSSFHDDHGFFSTPNLHISLTSKNRNLVTDTNSGISMNRNKDDPSLRSQSSDKDVLGDGYYTLTASRVNRLNARLAPKQSLESTRPETQNKYVTEPRPNSMFTGMHHSLNSLQDVLSRNRTESPSHGNSNMTDIGSLNNPQRVDRAVIQSESALNRDSMLTTMNQELFTQLKEMRTEVEVLRTENKRLTIHVERLSNDLESFGVSPSNIESL